MHLKRASRHASDEWQNHFSRGQRLQAQGRYRDAVPHYDIAARLVPTNRTVRRALAFSLWRSGLLTAAFMQQISIAIAPYPGLQKIASKAYRLWMSPVQIFKRRFLSPGNLRLTLIVGFCMLKIRLGKASKDINWDIFRLMLGSVRNGELWHFTADDVMTCVSDPKIIKWRTTSYSYEATLISKSMFHKTGGVAEYFDMALLSFVASLKILGFINQATSLYSALASHKKSLLAVHGWIGLGDISHIISLWDEQAAGSEALGVTSYSLFGGLRTVLSEQMKWRNLENASFAHAELCYRSAIKRDPKLVIGWHQLGRLNADLGRYARAEKLMQAARKRAATDGLSLLFSIEAARMGALAALSKGRAIDDKDKKILENFHEGTLRIVQKVEINDGAFLERAEQKIPIACDIYLAQNKTSVEKRLTIPPLSLMKDVDGVTSALNGAPFLLNGKQIQYHATPFPSTLGRELFSPLYLGQANGQEIYVSKTVGAYSDIILLPGLSDNYFHFLFDAVGSLAFVDRSHWEKRRFLMFSHGLKPYQEDIFRRLGIDPDRVDLAPRGNYFTELRNATITSYPAPNAIAHPDVVTFLRRELFGKVQQIQKGKRIYFMRGQARAFSKGDRDTIGALLIKYGFVTLDPPDMSFQDQIDAVSDAEVILIDAGAAAANLLFAPQEAKVIIMGTSILAFYEAWGCLASALNLDLSYVMADIRLQPKYLLVWCNFSPSPDIKTLEMCLKDKCA